MKPGDSVRIKDNKYNSANHRGLICIVLKVEKSVRDPDGGLVCVIQSDTERFCYHEGRLELISEPD